jgi:hypothetical protein
VLEGDKKEPFINDYARDLLEVEDAKQRIAIS